MLDDDEDLDQMSPERLRELKQEVLLRIEEIGSRDASVEPEPADEIKELEDLLNEIEERLSGPGGGAVCSEFILSRPPVAGASTLPQRRRHSRRFRRPASRQPLISSRRLAKV